MIKSITKAQDKSIHELKSLIGSFLKNRRSRTRVVPLSIPTGWGKTRIALQSVIRLRYSTAPNIVIWPQNQSHISKEVWLDNLSWCKKGNKDCTNCNPPKPIRLQKTGGRAKNYEIQEYTTHGTRFKANIFCVNNKFKGLYNVLQKRGGPILFIIDEWHTKGILDEYIRRKSNGEDDLLPEDYIRERLLGEEKKRWRKLLVILISGTPVGNTHSMDAIPEDENTDELYEKELENSISHFKQLIAIGNQERKYIFYDVYNPLIKHQQNKLTNFQTLISGKFKQTVKSPDWANSYIRIMRKALSTGKDIKASNGIYLLESLVLSGMIRSKGRQQYKSLQGFFKTGYKRQEVTFKLKTLKLILDTYRYRDKISKIERKFVIFCHHEGVFENVKHFLIAQNISVATYEKINTFNDSTTNNPRVMLVMDKHSQGVSMHHSGAWVIHFELSWNPIRILQRFGRVWRIDHNNKKLTCPVSFYIPHTFSAEEEMLNRLKRRWEILKRFSGSKNAHYVNLAPLPFEVALGVRCSPDVFLYSR